MTVVERELAGIAVIRHGTKSTTLHVRDATNKASVTLALPLDGSGPSRAFEGARVTIRIEYDESRPIDLSCIGPC